MFKCETKEAAILVSIFLLIYVWTKKGAGRTSACSYSS